MPSNLPNSKVRYPFIDYLRGVAIILMIIFHGAYDLNLFGFLDIDFSEDPFWFNFPRVIVFLFLFTMGCGLTIAHKNGIKWRPFWKRFSKIAICAIFITIGTYFAFPTAWVYFGTLHCIALTSLMALPFVTRPKLSFITGTLLIVPHIYFGESIPWVLMAHKSMDYIPPFPWLGVVLLGVFATHQDWHKINPTKNILLNSLEYLGLKSLLIYMLHQPILYALSWVLYKFTT
jgi:uncharacterized membrane protein